MIVLTQVIRTTRVLCSGDRFQLCIRDALNSSVIIDEQVTSKRVIDYVASFRFALDDGTCPGFHLTGIFANYAQLPIEIQNAVLYSDLPDNKRKRFLETIGTRPYTGDRATWNWKDWLFGEKKDQSKDAEHRS